MTDHDIAIEMAVSKYKTAIREDTAIAELRARQHLFSAITAGKTAAVAEALKVPETEIEPLVLAFGSAKFSQGDFGDDEDDCGAQDALVKLLRAIAASLASRDARIKELEEALLKYGGHAGSCESEFAGQECDCGWPELRRSVLSPPKEPT